MVAFGLLTMIHTWLLLCCVDSMNASAWRARYPHDKIRAVVNVLQVFNLLGRQKSPDFLEGPFALDRILEMSLCGGISSGDYEKDLS
jgi:hypothetical protein